VLKHLVLKIQNVCVKTFSVKTFSVKTFSVKNTHKIVILIFSLYSTGNSAPKIRLFFVLKYFDLCRNFAEKNYKFFIFSVRGIFGRMDF